MAYVVTFSGYRPSSRHDAKPWTHARIEEAPAETGPWTPIETIALSPLDADPARPSTRSFTTELATLASGWYLVTFLDETGDTQATEPVFHEPRDPLRPAVGEVAALLHARTLAGGVEVGTFNDATQPTAEQVENLITMAVGDVAGRVGVAIPDGYVTDARRLVALQAATLIEASYFPNELDTDRSAYRQYQAMFLNGIQALIDAARRPSYIRLV